MTRQERDQLITVMTELREFRRNTESSLKGLTSDVGVLMAAHNRQRGFITAAKLFYGLAAGAAALGLKWAVDNWRDFTHWLTH